MFSLYKNNNDLWILGELFRNQRQRINDIATVDFCWLQIEEVILWIAEVIGGAENVTVQELLKPAEYLEIKAILNQDVQLNQRLRNSN
ncbi:MAG: hypothetical protein MK132_17905 [Lentisphaerales bacterium]|nr:hypothetical protein [Lentisphaerales bacterium]